MRSFTFSVPMESGLRARYQESATLTGARTTIAESLVSAIPLNVNDIPLWVIAGATSTTYGWLSFYRITGATEVVGDSRLLPPVTADVALTTLYVSTKDITGVAEENVKLTLKLVGSRIVLGGALISRAAKDFYTDATGYKAVVVARGATVSCDFPPLGSPKTIDTTGRAGIDIALEP